MPNATQPKAAPLELAPGVHLVVSKQGSTSVYELVNHKAGFRQSLNELESKIVSAFRAGVSLDDATQRYGADAKRLYERLVGAGLLVQAKAMTFLPDDHPKLAQGTKLQRTSKQGIVLCTPPDGRAPTEMREVEAIIAKAFDGSHTVMDIVEAARMRGIPATLASMVSFLKELHGMGCLEVASSRAESIDLPPEEESDMLPVVTGVPTNVNVRTTMEVEPPPDGDTVRWGNATFQPDAVEGGSETSIPSLKIEALKSLSLDKEKAGGTAWVRMIVPFVVLGGAVAGGWWWMKTHPGLLGGGDATPTAIVAASSAPTAAATFTAAPPPSTIATQSSGATAPRVMVVQPQGAGGTSVMAAGFVNPKDPITLGVTIGGRVSKVLVKEGDIVKAKQVLIQLDDSQVRAQMGLAYAKMKDADRILDRTKTLFASQAATQVDLDKAQGAAEVANAEYQVYAQQLEQAKVRSPIDKGTILDVLTHPGEVLTPSATAGSSAGVVKLADLTQLVAEIDVNESDVFNLTAGQSVDVVPDASPNRKYPGIVAEIGQEADRSRGTVQVTVDLHVPDRSLRPGNSVKATFHPGSANRLLVPKTAFDQGRLWIVGPDGRVKSRPVTSRPAGPDMLEVTAGLSAGEQIVADGVSGLKAGQKVQ